MSSTQSGPADARPTRPWPADGVEHWSIQRLVSYANDPRKHEDSDVDRVGASITEFGWTNPVLVDENGNIIAGEARVSAALRLGLSSIPVVVARGWSEEKKQAYRVADNKLAERAGWDWDLLRYELEHLQFAGFDLSLTGFDPDQLQAILAGLGSSGLSDPDSVPEVLDQPVTRPRRRLAVGEPPDRLRRQHKRGRCGAGAGRSRTSPDGHRPAIRG
jgi:ParB-like chromosome segregation protein Spo0J